MDSGSPLRGVRNDVKICHSLAKAPIVDVIVMIEA